MKIDVVQTGPLGVNTFLIPLSENKVLVVDPANCAFSRDEDDMFDYMEQHSFEPVAIALTHGHFDHIAGLVPFRKRFPHIPIAIHRNDRKMIGPDSQTEQSRALLLMGFDVFLPSVSHLPDADVFFEDGKTLFDTYGELCGKEVHDALGQWRVIHTPGHTKGCVCLYNAAQKVLVSGDTMFYHSWGRTDLPGGNEGEIQKSLKKIAEIVEKDVRVYPGHDYAGFELSQNL